jgi:hypothetical protein
VRSRTEFGEPVADDLMVVGDDEAMGISTVTLVLR